MPHNVDYRTETADTGVVTKYIVSGVIVELCPDLICRRICYLIYQICAVSKTKKEEFSKLSFKNKGRVTRRCLENSTLTNTRWDKYTDIVALHHPLYLVQYT